MTDYITPNQMDALNQQDENNVKNIFKSNDTFLESDVDEQLIISVPFNQRKLRILYYSNWDLMSKNAAVKIHSVKIKAKNIGKYWCFF